MSEENLGLQLAVIAGYVLIALVALNMYGHMNNLSEEVYNLRIDLAEARDSQARGWAEVDQRIARIDSENYMDESNIIRLWLRDMDDEILERWRVDNLNFSMCAAEYDRVIVGAENPFVSGEEKVRAGYLRYDYVKGDLVLSQKGEVSCYDIYGDEVSCIELC